MINVVVANIIDFCGAMVQIYSGTFKKKENILDCEAKARVAIPILRQMAAQVYVYGLNIDYFPTNLVVQDELIYYIDYECNNYMEEWNFENWGIKYWSKTQEFLDYLNQHI